MKRKTLFGVIVATVALITQSCDSDFNEIGSGIFGDDGFNFETYSVQNIEASTLNTGEVSTRNLPINNLGVYNDPVFGKTVAHFVTQIEMKNGSDFININNNPVIDSVYIYIPYNSKLTDTDSDGNSTYTLNNTFGNGSFTLNVYENGYFLRNFDPNNNLETQEYYSSDKSQFDAMKLGVNGNGRLNNSSNSSQNTNFKISDQEIKLYKYNSEGELEKDSNDNPIVKERKKPGIWLDLDKAYFQDRFFTNSQYKNIINNSVLKEYFKGLYFNVETNNQEALAQLNIAGGELVFIYKASKSSSDATVERKELKLKIGYSVNQDNATNATTVNLIENQNSQNYKDALTSNSTNPIWIKGNNGSISLISLFGPDSNTNGIADELEDLKANEWLINQAVLTVYVDKNTQTNPNEAQPNRLFLYDAKNNMPLIDYTLDSSNNPSKSVYNGLMDITSESNLTKYRFRITNHINNLIKKDSTNVTLGLSVTSDITNSSFDKLKSPINSQNTKITKIPSGSTTSPIGTVLYGPQHSNPNTRMKLDIYYTQKNN